MGVGSTKVLKEVMEADKQEKNSKPGELFREKRKVLPLKAPEERSESMCEAEGEGKKTSMRAGSVSASG